MPILDNYFSVLEAGRRLKVHPETVKRLCRQGDLPANKIHNTWLINKDTLDNFAGTYNPSRGARKRLIKWKGVEERKLARTDKGAPYREGQHEKSSRLYKIP